MGSLTTAGEALHPTGFRPQVWKGAAERCRLMEHQLPATHQALQAPEPVTGSSAAVVWTPAPSGVAAPRASHSEGWCGADTNCNEPECLFTTKTCPCNTPSWPGTVGVEVLLGPVAFVSEETLKSTLQEGPNSPSPVQAGRVPVPAERGVRLAPATGSPLSGRPLCAAPHRSRLDEGGGRT